MGMIIEKSWPEPKPDPDGQNLTQIVSESDLIESKEGFKLWARQRSAEIWLKHLVPKPDRD